MHQYYIALPVADMLMIVAALQAAMAQQSNGGVLALKNKSGAIVFSER